MDAGRLIGLGAAAVAVAITAAPLGLARASDDPGAPVAAPARVFALDDDLRVRRGDGARAAARGPALGAGGGDVPLTALRGETVALQLVVIAGQAPIGVLTVSLARFSDAGRPEAGHPEQSGNQPRGGESGSQPRASVFRAHYLTVAARSRNDRHPGEALGWSAGARPPDAEMQGEVPDALIPIALDPHPVAPGPAVPAGGSALFWIDVEVPAEARAGRYLAAGSIATGEGAVLARFQLQLRVLPPLLPYRATSVFIYYEAERLESRLGTRDAPERQLWQLLHAHHIDALAPLRGARDLARLHDAHDGSLFTAPDRGAPDRGARDLGSGGPGAGVGPGVVALGAYGTLGAPGDETIARVEEMLAGLPLPELGGPRDVFLYAVDESCASPRASEWRRALAGRPAARRLMVGQTCNDPVERQAVDVALVSADAFTRTLPGTARAAGRRTWIYNGFLPRTGTLLLDADPRGLTANGWIAAVMGIERWFYWESIFWDDDNRGGHGPIDPFTTAESFHNRDGDSALGDGLLLYPGRQAGRFAPHSLGLDGVLPSLRLKFLRRGIEDAGLIALAARERPAETAAIVARALPAALDEARLDRPPSWESAPLGFPEARAALRALITRPDPIAPAEIVSIFDDLAARRRASVPSAPTPRQIKVRRLLGLAGIGIAITLATLLGLRARRHRRAAPV